VVNRIGGEKSSTVARFRGDGGRLSDQRGVGTAGCRGPLGQDDGARLVRYANSSANLRVFLLTS
jgi:hypothetical protein